MYKQCTFKMVGGNVMYHAWVPVEFAIRGKVLIFKNNEGQWSQAAWRVVSAGENLISGEYLRELERDYLHQRKASDI
jgi:hypothetical protein